MVCDDVEIEPALQNVNGETLNPEANTSAGARLDVHARGIWERQRSAFLMPGFVSQTQNLMKISLLNKSTKGTRMRRNVCMAKE